MKFHGVSGRKQVDHRPCKFLRHRNGRIPQAVIVYILTADFLPPGRGKFGQLPDDGLALQHLFVLFIDHKSFLHSLTLWMT